MEQTDLTLNINSDGGKTKLFPEGQRIFTSGFYIVLGSIVAEKKEFTKC